MKVCPNEPPRFYLTRGATYASPEDGLIEEGEGYEEEPDEADE